MAHRPRGEEWEESGVGALHLHPAFSGLGMEGRDRPGTPTRCHCLGLPHFPQAPGSPGRVRFGEFQG